MNTIMCTASWLRNMGLAVHSCFILCFSVLVLTQPKNVAVFEKPGRFVFKLTGIPFFAVSVNTSCSYNTTVCGAVGAANEDFTIPAGTNISRGTTNITVLGSNGKMGCININGSLCNYRSKHLGTLHVYNNKTVRDQKFRAEFNVTDTKPTVNLKNVKYQSYVHLFGRMAKKIVHVLFTSGVNLTGEAFNVVIIPQK